MFEIWIRCKTNQRSFSYTFENGVVNFWLQGPPVNSSAVLADKNWINKRSWDNWTSKSVILLYDRPFRTRQILNNYPIWTINQRMINRRPLYWLRSESTFCWFKYRKWANWVSVMSELSLFVRERRELGTAPCSLFPLTITASSIGRLFFLTSWIHHHPIWERGSSKCTHATWLFGRLFNLVAR